MDTAYILRHATFIYPVRAHFKACLGYDDRRLILLAKRLGAAYCNNFGKTSAAKEIRERISEGRCEALLSANLCSSAMY